MEKHKFLEMFYFRKDLCRLRISAHDPQITEPRIGHFLSDIYQEIETRKLERKSKQQISRLNDLLYRLNDMKGR